jgi:hypothetical protein
MKQLIRLKECELYKVDQISTDDGDIADEYKPQGKYKIEVQELSDDVSASVYGANITKMLRISSINKILEILLKSKVNNTQDNISKYNIFYDNVYYKITNVKSKYIDIERI